MKDVAKRLRSDRINVNDRLAVSLLETRKFSRKAFRAPLGRTHITLSSAIFAPTRGANILLGIKHSSPSHIIIYYYIFMRAISRTLSRYYRAFTSLLLENIKAKLCCIDNAQRHVRRQIDEICRPNVK